MGKRRGQLNLIRLSPRYSKISCGENVPRWREIEKERRWAGRLDRAELRRYEKLLPAYKPTVYLLEKTGRGPRLIKLSSDEVRKAVVNGTISNFCSRSTQRATRRKAAMLFFNCQPHATRHPPPRRKSYPIRLEEGGGRETL